MAVAPPLRPEKKVRARADGYPGNAEGELARLVRMLLYGDDVTPPRTVLLVDADASYGQALAALLRRQGDAVEVVATRAEALAAVRRKHFDVAVVDLFVAGGGPELAQRLSRRVPRLVLSFGAHLGGDELVEAALGFPVRHKAALPALLRRPAGNGNGAASRTPRRTAARRPRRAAAR